MWSRDTVSIALITDLLDSYSAALPPRCMKSDFIEFHIVSEEIAFIEYTLCHFYAGRNFLFSLFEILLFQKALKFINLNTRSLIFTTISLPELF